jgi:hypothetical protein
LSTAAWMRLGCLDLWVLCIHMLASRTATFLGGIAKQHAVSTCSSSGIVMCGELHGAGVCRSNVRRGGGAHTSSLSHTHPLPTLTRVPSVDTPRVAHSFLCSSILQELGLIGLRIQRMPSAAGLEFNNPATYPYLSVASPSCHDVSPLRAW